MYIFGLISLQTDLLIINYHYKQYVIGRRDSFLLLCRAYTYTVHATIHTEQYTHNYSPLYAKNLL
jgi:hypothetical protein